MFKRLQLVSSEAFSLGHGGNDAQKVMGIIGAAVIFYEVQTGNASYTSLESKERFAHFVTVYWWVPFTSFLCIALGT